jgi:hypothetical protein
MAAEPLPPLYEKKEFSGQSHLPPQGRIRSA